MKHCRYHAFKLLLLAFTLSAYLGTAYAQVSKSIVNPSEQIIYFDLPGQSLKNGLIEFAIQSKLTVIVDTGKVSGLHSRPVIGPFLAERALEKLLARTPLTFSIDPVANTITIEEAPINAEGISTSTSANESTNIHEIIVKATRYPKRYSTITNSQLNGHYASFSSARFINTLPSTLIRDQQPSEMSDLLQFASGVTPGNGLADTNDDFYIRGFPRFGLYVDGLRLGKHTGSKIAPETLEQIEILKGPATLFYGQAEPGGIINAVRKKPINTQETSLSFSSGSNGLLRISADTGGPVLNSTSLSYRLIAARKSYDQLRDVTDVERTVVSTSLAWEPSKNTHINFSFDRYSSQQTRDHGTIILAPLVTEADVIALSEPGRQARSDFDAEMTIASLEFHYFFTNDWSLNTKWLYQQEDRLGIRADREALYQNSLLFDINDLRPNSDVAVTDNNEDNAWLSSAEIYSIYDELAADSSEHFSIQISGTSSWFGVSNDLSFGLSSDNYFTSEGYLLEHRGDIKTIEVTTRGEYDVVDTIEVTFEENPTPSDPVGKTQQLDFADYGVYALNSISISENLRLSLGGRYSSSQAQRTSGEEGKQNLKQYKRFSTDAGLSYQSGENHQVYLNYSEGFKANYQIDDIGTSITKPELSNQIELGIKSHFFDDSLTSSAAIFSIQKKNIVEVEFIEGIRTAHTNGEQRVRGIDLDLSFQARGQIDLIATATVLNPEIIANRHKGEVPTLAAQKLASLFANFRVIDDGEKELSMHFGGRYVGHRYSSNINTEHSYIAPFTSYDAGIAFKRQSKNSKFKIQVFAKNIFDKPYTLASEGRLRYNQVQGRTLEALLTIDL